MGQKIHPFLFRVFINKNWNSSWYVKKKCFSNYLIEDIKIRNFIEKKLGNIAFGKILIQKVNDSIAITLYVKKSFFLKYSNLNFSNIYKLLSNYSKNNVFFNIKKIEKPQLDPCIIFHKIKDRIESKKPYKNLVRTLIQEAFRFNIMGIKILIKGRINGNNMSRKQVFKYGKIPLQTISMDIIYHNGVCRTPYGIIGVKVWICLGDLLY